MDASASEWSSGCESGWTVYLDESYQSQYQSGNTRRTGHAHSLNYKPSYGQEDEEEEDLSMVSDASSGPPNLRYDEEEENVECYRKSGFYSMEKAVKKKVNDPRGKYRHSCLDDTASSPALSCTNKYDPSNNQPGFVNGVKQGSFGFWKSTNPKRQDQGEPSLFRGRRRG